MSFKLSTKSTKRLDGVEKDLVKVVKEAIKLTRIDFGVICGMRTKKEQEALVASGASQTMKSKHLEGKAVDLMAYVDGRASWELSLYDDIADAMAIASKELEIPIRWGAAWQVNNIGDWRYSMQNAMEQYIDLRRSQGRRPFIDGPHFELS